MVGTKRDGQVCPHSVIDDFGIGFCLGSFLGFAGSFAKGISNFFINNNNNKGAYHAPRKEKMWGGQQLAIKRAPLFASKFLQKIFNIYQKIANFALWAGIFGMGQCALMAITGHDSIWNRVISGGLAGGTLNMRGFFITNKL